MTLNKLQFVLAVAVAAVAVIDAAAYAAVGGPCNARVRRNKATGQYTGIDCDINDCAGTNACHTAIVQAPVGDPPVMKDFDTCKCDTAVPTISCNAGKPTGAGYSAQCVQPCANGKTCSGAWSDIPNSDPPAEEFKCSCN